VGHRTRKLFVMTNLKIVFFSTFTTACNLYFNWSFSFWRWYISLVFEKLDINDIWTILLLILLTFEWRRTIKPNFTNGWLRFMPCMSINTNVDLLHRYWVYCLLLFDLILMTRIDVYSSLRMVLSFQNIVMKAFILLE
jgi:hypothetical protein